MNYFRVKIFVYKEKNYLNYFFRHLLEITNNGNTYHISDMNFYNLFISQLPGLLLNLLYLFELIYSFEFCFIIFIL